MPTIANGTGLSICMALPATLDQAAYEVLSFVQIRGARTVGDIGDQYQTGVADLIGALRPVQMRTGLAAQTIAVELFRIADAGQSLLRAAIDAPGSCSFQLRASDGLTMYFTAAVSSRLHGTFQSGSIADTKLSLEVDSPVLEI